MIIGLDVSTSIVGVCIMNNDGELLEFNHVNLKKLDNLYQKAITVNERMIEMVDKYGKFDNVFIEKPFDFFNSGNSTAITMSKLQRFNGMVSIMSYYTFEKEPILIEAKQSRKLVGIKVPKGAKAKEIVIQHIETTEDKFIVERTAKGNPKDYFYDMADAIVIAKAGLALNEQQNT